MEPAFDDSAKNIFHPRVGLISFGLAIITGAITFLLFIVSFIPESGTYTEQRFNRIFFGFMLITAPIFHLAGLVLGIIGAFKKNSKKVFSILGIVFNSLPLIFVLIVWVFFLLIALAVISSGGGWM